MINSITIEGFKSLQKVNIQLGRMNLFIGTNSSGKSNFFDALRLLQGFAYGFTVDEILNGKPKGSTSDVWELIRGGSSKALFEPRNSKVSNKSGVIKLGVSLINSQEKNIEYNISFSPNHNSITSENLMCGGITIYDSTKVKHNETAKPSFSVQYNPGTVQRPPHWEFEKSRSVLHQILKKPELKEEHRQIIEETIKKLSNLQRIDPTPSLLREYSKATNVKRMGEHGENFAALINTITKNKDTKSAYVSWLKELTPTELDDVKVLVGPVGDSLFSLIEKNTILPAPILSDGTLRFAAITAAFFQPDMPDTLTIEEIENGIHASRVRLLVELLRNRSEDIQIIATTHSPIVLSWLKEGEYKTTFYCRRQPQTGATLIKPLNEVENFKKIVRKQPIGDLFAEGWLEGAF